MDTPPDPIEKARAWVDELLLTHPEVRGVAVSFDYHGPGNDRLPGSLWRTRTQDRSPEEAVGMAYQVLKVFPFLFGVLLALVEKNQDALVATLGARTEAQAELNAVLRELDETKAALDRAKADPGGPAVTPGELGETVHAALTDW